MFSLEFTLRAENDKERLIKTGNKKVIEKLATLLQEIKAHPTTGKGKPERLKGCDG